MGGLLIITVADGDDGNKDNGVKRRKRKRRRKKEEEKEKDTRGRVRQGGGVRSGLVCSLHSLLTLGTVFHASGLEEAT